MKTIKKLIVVLLCLLLLFIAWMVFLKKTPCPADLNGDRITDSTDLALFKTYYGKDCADYGKNSCKGDLNNDGKVDSDDLGMLIGSFGNKCK